MRLILYSCLIITVQLFLVITFSWGSHITTENSITMDFVGDISFDGPVKYYQEKGFCSYNKTLKYVAEILRQPDLAIGNLESPFVTKKLQRQGQFQFKPLLSAESASVQALNFAGFDIMGLNNNHLNDYKEMSVKYTVKMLKQAQIKFFGYTHGQLNDDLPQEPLIVTKKGIRIGFLGYCNVFHLHLSVHLLYTCPKRRNKLNAGPAIYSDAAATRDVNSLKHKVDVIVVSMHWGRENQQAPTETQFLQHNYLQSLGVDLIIGCHPHVLQGHMVHNGTLTAFSLGDFLFGPIGFRLQEFYNNSQPSIKIQQEFQRYMDTSSDPSLLSRILRVVVNKQGFKSAQYLPIKIQLNRNNKCLQPRPVSHAQWIKVCSKKDKACLMNN